MLSAGKSVLKSLKNKKKVKIHKKYFQFINNHQLPLEVHQKNFPSTFSINIRFEILHALAHHQRFKPSRLRTTRRLPSQHSVSFNRAFYHTTRISSTPETRIFFYGRIMCERHHKAVLRRRESGVNRTD